MIDKQPTSLSTPSLLSWRHVPSVVILVTLLMLGLVIAFAYYQLRNGLREQISRRDAAVMDILWASEQLRNWEPEIEPVTDAADYLLPLLDTNRFHHFARLPTVKATRLFDTQGRVLIAVPEILPDAQLDRRDLDVLSNLKPISHFFPVARASDLSMLPEAEHSQETSPLLEILLPLHVSGENRLLGVAQFLLDGTSIAEEFAALDHKLVIRATAAFFAAGAILISVLALAFHQLATTNLLLVQRTQSLLQANQELALAAKTSAIGAVTAHLIHGLKNPLSGLQSFMAGRTSGAGEEAELDWNLAVSTTQRMQTLINETVRVLREQDGATEYELSLDEIVQLISSSVLPVAKQYGVEFRARAAGNLQFNNRDANLVVLILENLISNGIQATPAGGTVALEITQCLESVVCEVGDEGSGLPDHLKSTLFKPCQSTKAGGSGIGLAISKQLATSLGAALELKSSTSAGCVFALVVPTNLCSSASAASAERTCIS